MLLITCGYPKSGKSTFLDLLQPLLPSCSFIVRPSDWYPDDLDNIDASDRSEYQIACWEHALDRCTQLLKSPNNIVILDTCGTAPHSLRTVIGVARLHNHSVQCLFIATPISVCESRFNSIVIRKYKGRVKRAVEYYAEHTDGVIPVKHGSLDEWSVRAQNISDKLCHQQEPE